MKKKFQMVCLFAGFILMASTFSSCNLMKKPDKPLVDNKATLIAQAKTEIEATNKSITASKKAVQTANEKNTKAKEVKVEEAKLISETLIKSVSDKAEALITAKNVLSNFEPLTAEEIKAKTASLKQGRIDLETETTKLTGTFSALDAEIADSPITKAKAEIEVANKAIADGKTAVQTANEKNTRAKEVKVEEAKLISEALIKSVSDKAEALTTAKNALSNFEPLTAEEIKAKTASLKQGRIDLETETTKLTGTFSALDAEIADKEPAMPVVEGQDEKGNPVVVSTKEGKSISHKDLMKFKNKEENKNKVLNTEKINVTFDELTPSKLTEFFENFTHLNIDVSNETKITSTDTQDLGADGKAQYFQASKLAEFVEKINFVENPSGASKGSLAKRNPMSKFKKIKGNMVIADTFSSIVDDYRIELDAFVKDSYTKYDGTVIPRTKTWVTFSQLTRLIRWLKKHEFLNNTVRFGDMLVVNKRDGVQDVLNCVDMIINENIERFELKNKAGEERSIKFAGTNSISCYFILNDYRKSIKEITVPQLLQFSKRCRWKRQYKNDDGAIKDGGFDSMALRFRIKNLNCKKLNPDDLKTLSFEKAWFAGRFEGEDTDLSEISFKHATSNAAGVVSFTGVLPKNQEYASYGWLIIRDAEIPEIDESELDDPDYSKEEMKLMVGKMRLPASMGNLIVHNLKGLDKIAENFTKKEVSENRELIGGEYGNSELPTIGPFVGSEEVYKEFDRLCAFRAAGYWGEGTYSVFVCFTDRNNNIIKGPYERMRDHFKKNDQGKWELIECPELKLVPLGNYKQDEDGFFEKK
jgi:lipoprotein